MKLVFLEEYRVLTDDDDQFDMLHFLCLKSAFKIRNALNSAINIMRKVINLSGKEKYIKVYYTLILTFCFIHRKIIFIIQKY